MPGALDWPPVDRRGTGESMEQLVMDLGEVRARRVLRVTLPEHVREEALERMADALLVVARSAGCPTAQEAGKEKAHDEDTA
jgi:hypothetical protein